MAVLYRKPDSVKIFVDNGADINAQDDSGNTALGWSIFLDEEKIVKLLVENSADVDASFNNETTPLLFAIMFGKFSNIHIKC